MQHILVVVAILGAIFFLGRRLWRFSHTGKGLSCGCGGCAGCGSNTQDQRHPFPMYKP